MKPLNVLSKFENHFVIRTVRFQVQLEADGYFFLHYFVFATEIHLLLVADSIYWVTRTLRLAVAQPAYRNQPCPFAMLYAHT